MDSSTPVMTGLAALLILLLAVTQWPQKPQQESEKRGAELVSVVWRTNVVTLTNWIQVTAPNSEEQSVIDLERRAWATQTRN